MYKYIYIYIYILQYMYACMNLCWALPVAALESPSQNGRPLSWTIVVVLTIY